MGHRRADRHSAYWTRHDVQCGVPSGCVAGEGIPPSRAIARCSASIVAVYSYTLTPSSSLLFLPCTPLSDDTRQTPATPTIDESTSTRHPAIGSSSSSYHTDTRTALPDNVSERYKNAHARSKQHPSLSRTFIFDHSCHNPDSALNPMFCCVKHFSILCSMICRADAPKRTDTL